MQNAPLLQPRLELSQPRSPHADLILALQTYKKAVKAKTVSPGARNLAELYFAKALFTDFERFLTQPVFLVDPGTADIPSAGGAAASSAERFPAAALQDSATALVASPWEPTQYVASLRTTKPEFDPTNLTKFVDGQLNIRANQLCAAAKLFYVEGLELPNRDHQAEFNAAVDAAYTAWNRAPKATNAEHRDAAKTLYKRLDRLLTEESVRLWPKTAAISLQAMDALKTMASQEGMLSPISSEYTGPVRIGHSAAGAGAAAAAAVTDRSVQKEVSVRLLDQPVKYFTRAQCEAWVSILHKDATLRPEWFNALPSWQRAYFQMKVRHCITQTEAAAAEGDLRSFNDIRDALLAKVLAGGCSTMRIYGLSLCHNVDISSSALSPGPEEAASATGMREPDTTKLRVRLMRAACPTPDYKFVPKMTERQAITTDNVRQLVMIAAQRAVKEGLGFVRMIERSVNVRRVHVHDLGLLAPLIFDGPLNASDNNDEMLAMLREAMTIVAAELATRPTLIDTPDGQMQELCLISLSQNNHVVNNFRNHEGVTSSRSESPADATELLIYVAEYLEAQHTGHIGEPELKGGEEVAAHAHATRALSDLISLLRAVENGVPTPTQIEAIQRIRGLLHESAEFRKLHALSDGLQQYLSLLARPDLADYNGYNVMLFRAAIEALILSEAKGISLIHCKSCHDRAGFTFYQIAAMCEFRMLYGHFPYLDMPEAEAEVFNDLYNSLTQGATIVAEPGAKGGAARGEAPCAVIVGGHQAKVRASRGTRGLKEETNIVHPAVLKTPAMSPDTREHSGLIADTIKPKNESTALAKGAVSSIAWLCCRARPTEAATRKRGRDRRHALGLRLTTASTFLRPCAPRRLRKVMYTLAKQYEARINGVLATTDPDFDLDALFPRDGENSFAGSSGFAPAILASLGLYDSGPAAVRLWVADVYLAPDAVPADFKTEYCAHLARLRTAAAGMEKLLISREITPPLWRWLETVNTDERRQTLRRSDLETGDAHVSSAKLALELFDMEERPLPVKMRLRTLTQAIVAARGFFEGLSQDQRRILLEEVSPNAKSCCDAFCRIITAMAWGHTHNQARSETYVSAVDRSLEDLFGPDTVKAMSQKQQNQLIQDILGLGTSQDDKTFLPSADRAAIAKSVRGQTRFFSWQNTSFFLFALAELANLADFGVAFIDQNNPSDPAAAGLTPTFWLAAALGLHAGVMHMARHIPDFWISMQALAKAYPDGAPLGPVLFREAALATVAGTLAAGATNAVVGPIDNSELAVFPMFGMTIPAACQIISWLTCAATRGYFRDKDKRTLALAQGAFSLACEAIMTWTAYEMGGPLAATIVGPCLALLEAVVFSSFLCVPEPKQGHPEVLFMTCHQEGSARAGVEAEVEGSVKLIAETTAAGAAAAGAAANRSL